MSKAIGTYTLALLAVLLPVQAEEPEPLDYDSKHQQVLTVSSDAEQEPYLAFPSVVRADPRTILISYKRGRSHAKDPGASSRSCVSTIGRSRLSTPASSGKKKNLVFRWANG